MNISALRKMAVAVLLFGVTLVNLSCSGGGRGVQLYAASGQAYVFIGDTPPPGSTILKFEITLTGATLCPTVSGAGECQGSPQVPLISTPVDIELNQLQLESAFLSLNNVQAGTYAGVKLTFSNPELKLLFADGSIQELKAPNLSLNPATATPTFPNVLTVTADSSVGFLIDFNVLDSVQSSGAAVTGISPVVRLVELPATTQQPREEVEDTTGTVSNLTKTCPAGTFTLTDSLTGLSVADIHFDSTTEFDELNCDTLANDQIVQADLELRSPTQQTAEFFAKEIELVNAAGEAGMEGVVFQVNSPTQFVLLVNREDNIPNVPNGSFVTINADPSRVQFAIDAGDLPVESSMFSSGADLLAGQTVEVDVTGGTLVVAATGCATVADNCTVQADKLKLKKGTLTARVAGVSVPNFTLGTLPSLFGNLSTVRPLSADCQACAITSVQVTASDKTEFEGGLTGVSSLVVNDTVTVRGFLLKKDFTGPGPVSPLPPQLVAAKVRRQTP